MQRLTSLIYVTLASILLLPDLSKAQALERLTYRDDLFGWEAVGRLDLGSGGYCTGVLISPDQVLTAAHCVFDKNGNPRPVTSLLFRAGYRDGKSIAERKVSHYAVMDGYDYFSGMTTQNVKNDAALLELSRPIPVSEANPFAIYTGPAIGNSVSVVSYGRDRDNALSWQRSCGVLGQGGGLISFDCDVTFGSSGAPVFSRGQRRSQIVSLVVGGRQEESGKTVAYGMELPAVVSQLKRKLRSLPGAGSGTAEFRRERVGTARRASGAKFEKAK